MPVQEPKRKWKTVAIIGVGLIGGSLAMALRNSNACEKVVGCSRSAQHLQQAIDLTRSVLEVPDSHVIAIVPASDTGAVEIALWSLLGARGVDVLVWESFGNGWAVDVLSELKLDDVRVIEAVALSVAWKGGRVSAGCSNTTKERLALMVLALDEHQRRLFHQE